MTMDLQEHLRWAVSLLLPLTKCGIFTDKTKGITGIPLVATSQKNCLLEQRN